MVDDTTRRDEICADLRDAGFVRPVVHRRAVARDQLGPDDVHAEI